MTEVPRRSVIVAGVDGSPEAALALEVAIEEARLRGAVLHVTYAYAAMASQLTGSTAKEYYEETEHDARQVLEQAAAAAPESEGLEVEWLAIPGNPSEVLIEAS